MEPINESDEVIAMDTYDDDQTLYNQYIELDEKYPNIMRPYRKYYDDAMKRNNNVCIFVVINGKTHTVMISDDTTVNEFYAIMNNKLYAMDITHNPTIFRYHTMTKNIPDFESLRGSSRVADYGIDKHATVQTSPSANMKIKHD